MFQFREPDSELSYALEADRVRGTCSVNMYYMSTTAFTSPSESEHSLRSSGQLTWSGVCVSGRGSGHPDGRSGSNHQISAVHPTEQFRPAQVDVRAHKGSAEEPQTPHRLMVLTTADR